MARVLIVAYHFPPIGGGGVQRTLKFARYLPEFGHQPLVITGPGSTADRWTPADDTLASGLPPGVRMVRIPGPEPTLSTGWRRRAERLLDIPSPFSKWWATGVAEAGRAHGSDVDLIYGALVPYESAEATARLAREIGKPWIADLQDPWALDEMWIYPSGVHRCRDLGRMRKILNSADAVIMNTPEATERVLKRFPELRRRIVVSIPNGFDRADFVCPVTPRVDAAFRIVHTGYLHTALGQRHRRTALARRVLRGAPIPGVDILTRSHVFLLEALRRLIVEQPHLSEVIELHLAGVLSREDREIAAKYPYARLHGYLTHDESLTLVRSADLLFLPMQDLPAGTRAGLVPGKTYEYLASGRPILAAVPEGDARDLLEEAGNALIARPSDVDAMCRLIGAEIARWQAGEATAAPRPDVVDRYERRRQTAALATVFERALIGGRPPSAARAPTRRAIQPA